METIKEKKKKPINFTKNINIRADEKLIEQVAYFSKKRGIPSSKFIREAITTAISKEIAQEIYEEVQEDF